MSAKDWIKTLEVRHNHAMEILGLKGRSYWDLLKDGHIKRVGLGRGSPADYASLEAYHHGDLAKQKQKPKPRGHARGSGRDQR